MAFYWPYHNVALEIVDHPTNSPIDRDAYPDINVVRTSMDEIRDPSASERLMRRIAHEMGEAHPCTTPRETAARKRLIRDLDRALHSDTFLGPSNPPEILPVLEHELDSRAHEQEPSDSAPSSTTQDVA